MSVETMQVRQSTFTHENIYGFHFLDTQNEFNQITGEVTTRTNYTSEVFPGGFYARNSNLLRLVQ